MQPIFHDKRSAKIIVSLFVILLVCSIIYYQQRLFFVDTGWMVFNILNRNNFLFGEYRYGVFITQLVPLIAGFLHVPLKVILIAYSLSFQVFYLCVILLLMFRYRQLPLAILMACYFTLFVSDAFFWPHNEVHQGVAWMFLFFGIFQSRYGHLKPYHHLVLLPLGFLAIFSHFIVIIPFSYLWIYYATQLRHKGARYKPFIFYTLYLTCIFIVKYRIGINGWYDGAKLNSVKKLNLIDIWYSFSNGQAKTMGTLLLSNYWLSILLGLGGLFFALKQKHYFIALLTVAYCAGYFSLVCLTYPDAFGRGSLFYMESEWMALGIIAGALFVFKVLPCIKPLQAQLVLVIVFTVRIFYILWASQAFSQRLDTLRGVVNTLQRKNISKAIFIKSPATDKDFFMDWGTPVESLMYSTINGNKPVTFKIMESKDIQPIAADSFHSCFSRISVQELNSFYFKTDTVQSYQVLDYEEIKEGKSR